MSYQEIKVYLDKLFELEYQEYFVVFSPKGYEDVYIQFMPCEDNDLYCEVVSNNYLPDKHKLVANQISRLTELGFIMEADDVNYNRSFKANTETLREELAKLVLEIFVNIFGLFISGFDITFDG